MFRIGDKRFNDGLDEETGEPIEYLDTWYEELPQEMKIGGQVFEKKENTYDIESAPGYRIGPGGVPIGYRLKDIPNTRTEKTYKSPRYQTREPGLMDQLIDLAIEEPVTFFVGIVILFSLVFVIFF